MGNFITFELTDAELAELSALGWGSRRTDLACLSIVRDFLRRQRFKAHRRAVILSRKIDRAARARPAV